MYDGNDISQIRYTSFDSFCVAFQMAVPDFDRLLIASGNHVEVAYWDG